MNSQSACRIVLALAVVLFAQFRARADTLSDLKTTLNALRGTTPIRASLDIERSRKSSGRFVNHSTAGRVTLEVAEDESGLRITFTPDVIARAERESHDHESDPNRQTPTRDAVDETQPTDIAETLDFSGPLLDMLAIGQRFGEHRVMRDGHAVRLLSLKLTPKLPPEATSVWHVKFTEDRLDLWIGDDNLPIAAQRVRRGSAGFLFLRGEMNRADSWNFARSGDRLVITHLESSFSASGLGQRGDGKNVQTLTLR